MIGEYVGKSVVVKASGVNYSGVIIFYNNSFVAIRNNRTNIVECVHRHDLNVGIVKLYL